MCNPEELKHNKFRHSPFRKTNIHPYMDKHFMFHRFNGFPLKMMLNEIENKEEAIELLEIQIKRMHKYRKQLNKRMAQLDELEKTIEETISEIGKMAEFSRDEMKNILKKKYREFTNKMLDDY